MPALARPLAAATVAAVLLVTAACASTGTRASRAPRNEGVHGANAVSVIDEEDLGGMRVGRIEEMIAGRVPGLQVVRTSTGDYSLRIRGRNTILGNDEPLVVLDGMPLQTGALSRALASISPSDVARIEVLKDAGATAFYGMRGANGVILITTRMAR